MSPPSVDKALELLEDSGVVLAKSCPATAYVRCKEPVTCSRCADAARTRLDLDHRPFLPTVVILGNAKGHRQFLRCPSLIVPSVQGIGGGAGTGPISMSSTARRYAPPGIWIREMPVAFETVIVSSR